VEHRPFGLSGNISLYHFQPGLFRFFDLFGTFRLVPVEISRKMKQSIRSGFSRMRLLAWRIF
jgi:hypothetical protein